MRTKVFVVFAVAAVALGLTTIQQIAAAFNDKNQLVGNFHGHVNCDSTTCGGNEGGTDNGADPSGGNFHYNFNCNTHRASDQCKENSY
jgi:hypothetical protein